MLGNPGGDDVGDPSEWREPPRAIGGHVAGPVLIHRSDGLVVVARQVLAHPAGLEVEVEAHARGALPPDPSEPAGFAERAQPRFGLRLADGAEVVQDDGLRDGSGPAMTVSRYEAGWGGPDGGEDVRLTLWIRPLPPPGPLTLSCAWPERGLRGAEMTLDGAEVRAAASRARPFWPDEQWGPVTGG